MFSRASLSRNQNLSHAGDQRYSGTKFHRYQRVELSNLVVIIFGLAVPTTLSPLDGILNRCIAQHKWIKYGNKIQARARQLRITKKWKRGTVSRNDHLATCLFHPSSFSSGSFGGKREMPTSFEIIDKKKSSRLSSVPAHIFPHPTYAHTHFVVGYVPFLSHPAVGSAWSYRVAFWSAANCLLLVSNELTIVRLCVVLFTATEKYSTFSIMEMKLFERFNLQSFMGNTQWVVIVDQ